MRSSFHSLADQPATGGAVNWGHPSAQGLLGLWLFTEGTGLRVNDLAGGHPLTFSGTRQVWKEQRFGGKFERGLAQPNSGSGLARNTALRQEIILAPQLTVELWFTASTSTAVNGYFGIIATSAGGFPKYRIMRNGVGNQLYAQFYLTSGSVDSTGVKNPFDGKLHHFVATYDQQNIKTYMDGQVDGNASGGTLAMSNSAATELHFGGYPTGTNFVDATYYKTAIWNRGMYLDEIRELYENPFGVLFPQSRRVAYDVPGAAVGHPALSRLRGVPGARPGRIFAGGWS